MLVLYTLKVAKSCTLGSHVCLLDITVLWISKHYS